MEEPRHKCGPTVGQCLRGEKANRNGGGGRKTRGYEERITTAVPRCLSRESFPLSSIVVYGPCLQVERALVRGGGFHDEAHDVRGDLIHRGAPVPVKRVVATDVLSNIVDNYRHKVRRKEDIENS